MKMHPLGFLLPLLLSGCTADTLTPPANSSLWSPEMAQTHLAHRQDSSTWDQQMFHNDLSNTLSLPGMPFSGGVFPVPDYDLLVDSSFKGVGNFGYPGGEGTELRCNGKPILFNSFFAGANPFNQDHLPAGAPDEIFFQIILLTDTVDTLNYTHLSSEIVSRNHPDYIGQGFYRTRHHKVDYTAFLTAGRDAYAIVNMRLFDLSLGKTILIAPQQDNSLRSLQVQSPPLSSKEVEAYTAKLLAQPEVKAFFSAPGNI